MNDKLDPVLYLGLDVATKRDTCALTAITPDDEFETYIEWGYKVWSPPVNLVTQVQPFMDHIFTNFRVAGLWYDPFQAITLIQRLKAKGYGYQLVEVGQAGAQMIGAANTLHDLLVEDRLDLIPSEETRAYFSWTSARRSDRGYRIVKQNPTKPVDYPVSLSMTCFGANQEHGHGTYPAWSSSKHVRSPFVLEEFAA
jgi:hypothetical protein